MNETSTAAAEPIPNCGKVLGDTLGEPVVDTMRRPVLVHGASGSGRLSPQMPQLVLDHKDMNTRIRLKAGTEFSNVTNVTKIIYYK